MTRHPLFGPVAVLAGCLGYAALIEVLSLPGTTTEEDLARDYCLAGGHPVTACDAQQRLAIHYRLAK